ncbi:hypothetical protein CLOP_g11312 [Closterium sp. NIES-67]|nr:hypothetical protein CLOP_g11312 [Closterium sp. NIES-67]
MYLFSFVRQAMVSANDIAMVLPPSPSPAKIPRRSSYFWKVSTVVLLAICGLSLCIKSISHTASSFDLFSSLAIVAVPVDAPQNPPFPSHSSSSSPSRSLAAEESEEEKEAARKAQREADSRELEKCPAASEVEYGDLERFGQHYPNPLNYSRAECLCNPVHNFVVLSMQRSGSGWFETFLNSHPNISSHGEIFIVRPRRANASAVAETLDRVYNLDWTSSAAKNSCTSAVGFKWMLNQGAMEFSSDVAEYFKKRHVSVILLIRKNVLRRLISILANAYDRKTALVGVHKSHTHSKEEAEKLATFRPNVSAKHLEGNLQRVQEMVDDALRAFNGTRRMLVYYEDVVKNKTILEEVQRFLGVPAQELTSKQVKIHTRPLRESIENYDDVAKKLKGTEFEKFLVDESYD